MVKVYNGKRMEIDIRVILFVEKDTEMVYIYLRMVCLLKGTFKKDN